MLPLSFDFGRGGWGARSTAACKKAFVLARSRVGPDTTKPWNNMTPERKNAAFWVLVLPWTAFCLFPTYFLSFFFFIFFFSNLFTFLACFQFLNLSMFVVLLLFIDLCFFMLSFITTL